jgi:2-polyprenyl-3-methyl-5-hydroxy-6-metoxy-1,4-benzoquinol methylase
MMSEISAKGVYAGQAPYTKLFLAVYNPVVQFNYRFVWGCHPRHVLDLYKEHVSANHLDVGVATGSILDHCRFPSPTPRLALMDLNPNSLEVASKRLARYAPEIYLRDVLEAIEIEAPRFDSLGVANLLHCLPGTMQTKAVVFEHLKGLLNPGGMLFGCTILYGGVERSLQATLMMHIFNARGAMTNKQDDLEGLRHNLDQHFSGARVRVIGSVALFWARNLA